jgi:hypothetical protein
MQPLDCSGAQLDLMPLALTARQNTRSVGTPMVRPSGPAPRAGATDQARGEPVSGTAQWSAYLIP